MILCSNLFYVPNLFYVFQCIVVFHVHVAPTISPKDIFMERICNDRTKTDVIAFYDTCCVRKLKCRFMPLTLLYYG